jgi:hypothetical protein
MYADAESAPGRVLIIIAALPDYDRADTLVPGCRVVTCGLFSRGALTRPLLDCGGAVCADGQDGVGSHGGADRVLLTPQGTGISSTSGPRTASPRPSCSKRQRGSGLPPATRAAPQIGRRPAAGGSLVITSSRAGHLRDALCRAREVVGFDSAAEGDEAFRQLVLARIIESASEQDSLRVLGRPGLIRRHVPGAPRPARLLRSETIVFAGSRSARGSKTELACRSSSFLKDGPPLPRATRQSREPRHHCGPNPARRPRRRPQADPPPGSRALI